MRAPREDRGVGVLIAEEKRRTEDRNTASDPPPRASPPRCAGDVSLRSRGAQLRALLRRTTSRVGTSSDFAVPPSIALMRAVTVRSPSSSKSWRTVVSGGR